MIDKNLYCETFSRLRASDKAKKEVIQMKEMRKQAGKLPKLLRTAAIAAALTAALAITANAASNGMLVQQLRVVWSNGFETHLEGTAPDGTEVAFNVTAWAPQVEEEDGRLFLTVLEERLDITDQLAENGIYHWTGEQEGHTVSVDVEGTTESWIISTWSDGGVTYTWDEEGGRMVAAEDGTEVGTAQRTMMVTITED